MTTLKGHFKGENDFFIGSYRLGNEVSESLLYVYGADGEFIMTIDMPEFWEEYLLEAQTMDEEIELKFEKYVIEELSL